MSTSVKMIKKDAVINLQHLLFYIGKDLSMEQIEQYKKEAEAKQEFSEDWMTHVTTISVLIKEIEKKAEEQGHVYDGEIPSTQQGN